MEFLTLNVFQIKIASIIQIYSKKRKMLGLKRINDSVFLQFKQKDDAQEIMKRRDRKLQKLVLQRICKG